jgi:hypothetical protein
VLAVGLTVLAIALSACGAPQYRFYASDTNELVLKVPRSWTQVRAGVPVGSDGQQTTGNWVSYYDAAPRPSPEHVQSVHATSPTAVMATMAVTKEVGAALTDDELRDQVYPVSAPARAMAHVSGFTSTGFTLHRDEPIQTRTARGIHVVFTYDHGQGPEVYDQVVVTDSRKTRVHVLLVHCTQACYESNRSDITETVRSFTVRIA